MNPALIVDLVRASLNAEPAAHAGVSPVLTSLTVFVLACFIGYYVVWRVTPALHSPLMAVTNAVSSVIIVGAILAAGSRHGDSGMRLSQIMGFCAVALAAVNIFGGFVISQRMLSKFKKKQK
jgi:NAD(P) transhydrogenase subunit alpha